MKTSFLIIVLVLSSFHLNAGITYVTIKVPSNATDSCTRKGYAAAGGSNYLTIQYNETINHNLGDGQQKKGGIGYVDLVSETSWVTFTGWTLLTAEAIATDNTGTTLKPPLSEVVCDGEDPDPLPVQNQQNQGTPDPLNNLPNTGGASPIVIDLDGNGFRFGDEGVGVYFDLLANGNPLHMQWVNPGGDDAFLVLDHNGNGIVDDGSELFGDGTRMLLENHRLAPNGFVGLAQYDNPALGGNDDGYISEADTVWNDLSLWLDFDGDGVCTAGEMASMDDFGLVRLNTIPRETRHYDLSGNWLRFFASALTADYQPGFRRRTMVDVYFKLLGDVN